jgi:hypothetical protein
MVSKAQKCLLRVAPVHTCPPPRVDLPLQQ